MFFTCVWVSVIKLLWMMMILQVQGFQPTLISHQSVQRQRPTSYLRVVSTLSRNETASSVVTEYHPSPPPSSVSTISGSTASPTAESVELSPTLPPPVQSQSHGSSRPLNSVEAITTTTDLTAFMLGSQNEDELMVVKYYAHYCKICQRAGIQLKKIASEYPDVRFAKVESMVFPDSAQSLRSLGVTKFPFVQIYRKGQCVASFSTGPSHLFVKKVRDTIDICLNRSPEEWESFVSEFSNEIEANQQARESLFPTS